MVLNSDSPRFGGHDRIDESVSHHAFDEGYAGRRHHVCLYIPCRTAQVLAKVEEEEKK